MLPKQTQEPISFDSSSQEAPSPHPQEVHRVGFIGSKKRHRFHSQWRFLRHKKFWLTLFLVVDAVITIGWFVEPIRFWAFNTAGIKAGVVIAVSDAKSRAALEDAKVSLNGKEYHTQRSQDGKEALIRITDARFGKQTLEVRKEGYAQLRQDITVKNFASRITAVTPATQVALTPTGLPVGVHVTHWLSGRPLADVKVSFGKVTATTNKEGKTTLNIPPTDKKEIRLQLKATNFLSQKVTAKVGGSTKAKMVASPRHYFLSKRTGVIGIYSSNLDGSDTKELVKGTGYESDAQTAFEVDPQNKLAAYVSTRTGQQDTQGQLLKGLYLVQLEQSRLTQIDEAPYISLVSWLGDYIVYIRSITNSQGVTHQEIMSYQLSTTQKRTLAQADYFVSVLAGEDKIFFAPGEYQAGNTTYKNNQAGLMSITPSEDQAIIIENQRVQRLNRPSFTTLDYLTTDDKWHSFALTTNDKNDLQNAPANTKTLIFAPSSSGKHLSWVDERDGKAVLLMRNTSGGDEKVLEKGDGIGQPVTWIGEDMVLFRVVNSSESADYIVSLQGGKPQKITDVFAAASVVQGEYE